MCKVEVGDSLVVVDRFSVWSILHNQVSSHNIGGRRYNWIIASTVRKSFQKPEREHTGLQFDDPLAIIGIEPYL